MNRSRLISLILCLFLLFSLFSILPSASPPALALSTSVFINEIHYDNDSTDAGEAIEIAGPAGTDLSGWSLVLYNGSTGGVYNTTALSGVIPDQQAGYGTLSFSYPVNGIQNGSPDGLALVDSSSAVIQFLSYEGSFAAVDGPANGLMSTDIGVAESSSTVLGESLQLAGTGANYEDFSWSTAAPNTFGAINTGQTFEAPPTIIPIYDIQYTSDPSGDSPYKDQFDITTEGIVTAAFYNGYFIEDPAGGPWTGLWVYDSNIVVIGDRVRITGTIAEYNNLTELTTISDFSVLSSGNPLPPPATLSSGDVSQEQWEGVLVRVENVSVTDEDLGYGEWSVSDGSGDVFVDDKSGYTYVPVLGDALNYVQGPLDYGFGAFKIQPRHDGDIAMQVPLPDIVINEVDADQTSTDSAEFVELYDGGEGSTSLSGLVLVFFNGNGDKSYAVFDLDGFNTDAEGYFVLCGNASNVPNCDSDVSPNTNLIQNGADAVALFLGDTSDFPSNTPVTTTNLIDALVYDTGQSDDAGLLPLLNAGQPQVNEGGGGDMLGDSNQRCPNGSGGLRNTSTFEQWAPSPGEANYCEEILELGACGDPATFVHEVQGPGFVSPLTGVEVVVEGVVVGDFQGSDGLRGFFLQEESAQFDADPMTSEGVFVFDNFFGTDVQNGDVVRVLGTAAEYYDLTEITGVSDLAVCPSGASLEASPISLPVTNWDEYEPFEGMLVQYEQELYVTENYYLGRYGEIYLSEGDRLFNPTNVKSPGDPAIDLQKQNDLRKIQVEDGSGIENPDPLPPYFPLDGILRSGDTILGLNAVLGYAYGEYELYPVGSNIFTHTNERLPAPDVGGTLKVASFNVLNYFTSLDDSGPICGPAGDQDCRGADTAEEFTRQRDKIISAIVALDADVIGVIEIENHPSDAALADLVDGLNDVVGAGTYDYIHTGPIGNDAIKVGFIYQPGTLTPYGGFSILDSSVDPTFKDDKNRPVLAQSFMENVSGEVFTAAVNHLKSKGSSCDDVFDPDTGDGQGNCNLTRTSAAIAQTNWLASDPTGSEDPNFIIIGDLNSYAMEDPITAIEGAGYLDLIEEYVGATAYSYVYQAQAGYLDHALANPSMAAQVTGTTVWHINADEPSALDYNNYNQPGLYNPDPYRSSDHDPVVVGLQLSKQCQGMNATVYVDNGWIVGGPWDGRRFHNALRGSSDPDVMVGTDGDEYIAGYAGDDLICGLGGNDVLSGWRGDDTLYGDDGNDVLIGWKGNDILFGGDGYDVLHASHGNDTLDAGTGRDFLNGGQGTDSCNGGEDADWDRAVQCEVKQHIP